MAKSRKRTPAKPSAVVVIDAPSAAPSYQTIAARAYELFLLRGATHGHDWRDWLAAERELSTSERGIDSADYAG